MARAAEIADALGRLDQLTRRLRRECPWDREQDARSIVPHTLEEAYELADAVHGDDDAKVLDELGDVLFQVHFLSLLLEERGAGDLAAVAQHCVAKLIRRHPHVFGDVEAQSAGDVLRNWDRIKRDEPGRERGLFGEVPENLPALLHARKVQRRASSSGFDFASGAAAFAALREELGELEAAAGEGDGAGEPAARDGAAADRRSGGVGDALEDRFEELGDVLFAAVAVARSLHVDPELALRGASERFRARLTRAAEHAARDGRSWDDLGPERQLAYYDAARNEGGDSTA